MCHNFKSVCGRHFNRRSPSEQSPGEGDGRGTDVSEKGIPSLESNSDFKKRAGDNESGNDSSLEESK